MRNNMRQQNIIFKPLEPPHDLPKVRGQLQQTSSRQNNYGWKTIIPLTTWINFFESKNTCIILLCIKKYRNTWNLLFCYTWRYIELIKISSNKSIMPNRQANFHVKGKKITTHCTIAMNRKRKIHRELHRINHQL
jgi:hypothetical protein